MKLLRDLQAQTLYGMQQLVNNLIINYSC